MEKPGIDDHVEALQRMIESPADRVGTFAKMLQVAFGGAAGYVAAAGVALPKVAGMLAFLTPGGWIFGGTILGAALAYAIVWVAGGARIRDGVTTKYIEMLWDEIVQRINGLTGAPESEDKFVRLLESLQEAVKRGMIDTKKSTQVIIGVVSGKIKYEAALDYINGLDLHPPLMVVEPNNSLFQSLLCRIKKTVRR